MYAEKSTALDESRPLAFTAGGSMIAQATGAEFQGAAKEDLANVL
ncbi:MAG: hypothetical protein O7E55_03905 [Chloroflexi bacterium]|nr:hypothetical protein [Chloroflexota bacterium]